MGGPGLSFLCRLHNHFFLLPWNNGHLTLTHLLNSDMTSERPDPFEVLGEEDLFPITADPDTGQTELVLPDPGAAPEPEIHFPDGPRDWMRWAQTLDLDGMGTRRSQETARLILAELAASVKWNPDADGYGKAWPSMHKIADRIRRSRNTVRRIMRRLESAGYVVRKTRKRPDGGFTSNLFALAPAVKLSTLGGDPSKLSMGGDPSKHGSFEGSPPSKHGSFEGSIEPNTNKRTNPRARRRGHADAHTRTRAKAGGDSDSDKRELDPAKAWLRKHGVQALGEAKVATDDPDHWKRVTALVDGNAGEYGPGLIVQFLRGDAEIPESVAYVDRTCRKCHAFPCHCAMDVSRTAAEEQAIGGLIKKTLAEVTK